MLKKILIVPIVLLLIVSFCNTGGTTTVNSPNGYYQITGGKLKTSVNFPSFFKIRIELPNLAMIKDLLGGCFVFYYLVDPYDHHVLYYDHGPFSAYLPLDLSNLPIPLTNQAQAPLDAQTEFPIMGEWSMTGSNKFVITPADENGDPVDIAQSINDLLATQDPPLNMITAEVTKYSFTGSVNSNGSLKVKLALGISIDAFITTGAISLTGSFKTSLPSSEPPEESYILSNTMSAPNGSVKGSSKDIANWVVKILKGLPLKNLIPAN
jgi:hypothetical protein